MYELMLLLKFHIIIQIYDKTGCVTEGADEKGL